MPTEPQILDEKAIAKIEAKYVRGELSNRGETRALCQTVRAARAEIETQRQQYSALDEDWKELDAENAALRDQLAGRTAKSKRDWLTLIHFNRATGNSGKQSRSGSATSNAWVSYSEPWQWTQKSRRPSKDFNPGWPK